VSYSLQLGLAKPRTSHVAGCARTLCSLSLQLVADRDKATRAAALGTLGVVYLQEGPAIWKGLGQLSDQQRSLIEVRHPARLAAQRTRATEAPTPRAS
jgi:hypothetical protein